MTLHEAIVEIRRVGTIREENGKLKIRFPEAKRACLEPAIEVVRSNRSAALTTISGALSVPPAESWPASLKELADERAAASGDPDGALREVWISWCQWKAHELNRIFRECGTTGQPGKITAETVAHGLRSTPKLE